MNCMIFIYPKFCLLQDILTKDIIGVVLKEEGSTIWMILVLVALI